MVRAGRLRFPGADLPAPAPVESYLADLHSSILQLRDGKTADYIPELGKANPSLFGIALATADGKTYEAGDSGQQFTIQSVSKPFMYGYALQRYGRDAVLERVGVEPTGEAFNSIVLDEVNNRPFNPMVNAGAIAMAALMEGDSLEQRKENMVALFSSLAGRRLEIDQRVFESERDTGHRNRAITYMMLNTGMISGDPVEVLDLYFAQCSLLVSARDLAIMAATLANDGTNPLTGKTVFDPRTVRDVVSVMNSCGMYDYAGEWSYDVGMPAKSGVSGCIIAAIPGQIGLAVYSPPIDSQGNSVRGIRVCQAISNEFELHAFNNRTSVQSVLRREYRGDVVRSNRLRAPEERKVLADEGVKIVGVEAQGALFFGSAERLLRRLDELAGTAGYMVVDFKRVHLLDKSARRLIVRAARRMATSGTQLVFADIAEDGPLAALAKELAESEDGHLVKVFRDADAALEWCEDQLLAQAPFSGANPKFALSELSAFKGLSREEYRLIEGLIRPLTFDKGEIIIREGDQARLFFVLARGTVSVWVGADGTPKRKKRVASIGPGLTFGEMALLDGGTRSAEIVADERVVCYGLAVDQIRELSEAHPNVMITILGNLTREFSERLRHANDAIQTLE